MCVIMCCRRQQQRRGRCRDQRHGAGHAAPAGRNGGCVHERSTCKIREVGAGYDGACACMQHLQDAAVGVLVTCTS